MVGSTLPSSSNHNVGQNTFNTMINQNGWVHNNPVFNPELGGLGTTKRLFNESFRRVENMPPATGFACECSIVRRQAQ